MANKHSSKYTQMGLNIAYYRKLKGLTQEALCEIVDISRTHLSNIEAPNVEKNVSLEVLFDIADALDISPSTLFELRSK
ncbi:MAG: anaerobic benzoate catabolism transcriptional regulator [Firmicutes bacterium ADurb.Bin193]|nr:MAG: anaerobic benzoate catabolism transcriptional regulator [Firmicutes bacterium ADurb.Bin193]